MNTITKLMTILLALMTTSMAGAYDFEVNGIYYNVNGSEATVTFQTPHSAYNTDYTGDVVIPETVTYDGVTYSVTAIGSNAFYFCQDLTSIHFPNSLINIGENAFAETRITEVVLPESLQSLGKDAFKFNNALKKVHIGASLMSIPENAFKMCAYLSEVSLPSTIKKIDRSAFGGCWNLTIMPMTDSLQIIGEAAFHSTGIKTLKTGKTLTSIGENAFTFCYDLTRAEIDNQVTTLGKRAFADCPELQEIIVGNGVHRIPESFCSWCDELISVSLGTAVDTLDAQCFECCKKLNTVICKAEVPPVMNGTEDSFFHSVVFQNATLYVPSGSVEAYRNAPVWEKFVNIQPIADDYEYVPFVREGVKWVYRIADYRYEEEYKTNPARGDNVIYRTLEIKGDTIINGKTYKAVHKCTDDVYSEPSDVIPVYLREENKMVYGIVPDGKYYDDARLGYLAPWNEEVYSGEEFLLYDFQDPVAYWDSIDSYRDIHLQVDTIMVGGRYVKRYFDGEQEDYFQIIEGIGAVGMNTYPLAFLMPMGTGIHDTEGYSLEKVIENGGVIYPHNYVENRYMPVIREGVKWVNVHVVINDSDTTYNYYTYEFKGNYPERDPYDCVFKAVYSQNYTANGVDYGDEKLVAGLRENEALILSFRNEALNGVDNLINFYSYYGDNDVRYLHEDLEGMWDIDYYINNQTDPDKNFLTTDNFVKADPIEIDGFRCSRIAYIGEQGDTLAYIVEGIGFDSRDMGDLLTPFTRYPEADCGECYQEYCGLSHVIKDGKIIYKGLGYRPIVPGDVNGDGEVTVGDANSVIDVVIMGGNAGHTRIPATDVNGDGEINIGDVNAIIDIILTQNH